MAQKTTLTPYGLSGRKYNFTAKIEEVVIGISGIGSVRTFKRLLPLLKNKDLNWAGSYTGKSDIPYHLYDIYPIVLYIDQEREFVLYIDRERAVTLER